MNKTLWILGWIFTAFVGAGNALYVIQTGNRLPVIGYVLGGLALLFIFASFVDD